MCSRWIALGAVVVVVLALLVRRGDDSVSTESQPPERAAAEGPAARFIDAGPAFSRGGGRVAFVRGLPYVLMSFFELHVVALDTGRVRRLVDNGVGGDFQHEPAWSADGEWISFTSGADSHFCNEDDSVALVRPDGSGFRLLNRGCRALWAPVGDRLAFLIDGGLWVGGPRVRTPRLLFQPGPLKEQNGVTISERVWAYDWAPDGRRLVFQRGNELWIVNADGTGLRQLRGVVSHAPDWSPDGRWIAFGRFEGGVDGHERIWLVRPDGTGAHPLTARGEEMADPSWSPDGTQILVYGDGGPWLLTPAGERRRAPSSGVWSPDGKALVSGGSTAGTLSPKPRRLIAVRVDGGGARRLTQR